MFEPDAAVSAEVLVCANALAVSADASSSASVVCFMLKVPPIETFGFVGMSNVVSRLPTNLLRKTTGSVSGISILKARICLRRGGQIGPGGDRER